MSLETAWQPIKSEVIDDIFSNIGQDPKIIWNVGLGDGSGLLGSLQHICEEWLNQRIQFEHTIRISVPAVMDPSGSGDVTEKNAVLAVANALDLMDEPHKKLKNEVDEVRYYSYGYGDDSGDEDELMLRLKRSIRKKIEGKRCLVIIEYLLQPLYYPKNEWLREGWLPNLPARFSESSNWWLISTPSFEVYEQSLGKFDSVLNLKREVTSIHKKILESFVQGYPFSSEYILPRLVLVEELQRVAHHSIPISSFYSSSSSRESRLWSCLLYTQLLSPVQNYCNSIEAKELIRFWICEGLFTRTIQLKWYKKKNNIIDRYIALHLEEEKEEENTMITSTDHDHELFEFAKTILEALLSSSLLQSSSQIPTTSSISFPSPNTSHRVFPFSGMWQLISKLNMDKENRLGLLTEDDISNPTQLAKRNWISLEMNSCKYIAFPNPNKSKTTTLTLRGRKDISQPTIETLLSHMPSLRVLDLSYTSIEALPPSLARLTNLRLFSLKHCQKLTSLTPDSSTPSPVSSLERLEVLDLHGVPLIEIPKDFGSKKFNIFYLDLSCPTITSLPFNLFADMESRLRELVFLGCKSLTSLPPLVSLKNLEILSVSETKLTYLPSDTFKQMLRLRVLKLVNNNKLEKLPESLCKAKNLEEVELNGCGSLLAIDALPTNKLKVLKLIGNNHMVELPESLLRSQNLRELKVSDCKSLTEIKLIGLPSLKSFSLTQSLTISLSLRGCRELETVVLSDLDRLEELNLSGTAIKELTPEIFGLLRLRKLDVQVAPQLRRVPWHLLDHFPEILNIDQCEHLITANGDSDDHGNINHPAGVHISVRDSHLFYTWDIRRYENFRHILDGGSLRSFYILVSSCAKRKEKMSRGSSRPVQPQICASLIYNDTYYYKDLIEMPHLAQQLRYRHVEISSTEQKSNYLYGLLETTESLSLKDNEHLVSVTNLHDSIPRLKDVIVERCQGMKEIFTSHDNSEVASKLENIRVGHLSQIVTLFKEKYFKSKGADLFALKHLHVSNCGNLESFFPDVLIFPSLETLTITYCDRLRTVFYKSQEKPDVSENCLQSLRNIRFHELPQIEHIYEEQQVGPLRVPQWKTLYFRGCWSMRQLPLLAGPHDQHVCIDGEARQCKKIITHMKAKQLSHYKFKFPPPVASLKDNVKNMIFLK